MGDHLAVRLYQELLLPRLIENKMLALLRRGQLSKWFSGIGQEAISIGLTAGLRSDDWVLPVHRNLGVFTSRGVELERLLRQLMGLEGGFTQGRDRSFHFGLLDHHIVGMISHLGAMAPVADGLALAAQLRGEERVAAVLIGDGATSEGDVHEAMNLAAVWRLQVLFVVENNAWGLSTPTEQQYACAGLADRAYGYGMPGRQVDGNDVFAVLDLVEQAAAHAREGYGPVLVECCTYRMRGHEEASGTDYMPADEMADWAGYDPLALLEARMVQEGLLDEPTRQALEDELQAQVDAAVAAALAAPPPPATDPAHELGDVFAPAAPLRRPFRKAFEPGQVSQAPHVEDVGADPRLNPDPEVKVDGEDEGEGQVPAGPTAQLSPASEAAPGRRYIDAVSDALWAALAADERVLLLGQDIAEYGGVFKVTDGMVEEFGADRVRNTPIIESGALGAALGLALDGFRPVVEMQFADFISCGFNQIVNNLATTHYRWGAPVPVVIRAPSGGGLAAGPFHSQNVEAHFAPVPGLKVVAPATPADAKGLLLASLDDNNPVLFLEHKWLYRNAQGPVPDGHHTVPLGQGRIARPGRDATVVAYGVAVHWALEAARELAESAAAGDTAGLSGTDVEVIDLRTLQPWDRQLVLESVRRTSRALVVHEAGLAHGIGAEVAAVIADEAFEHLDAPVRRVGGLETPVPFAPALEAMWSPRDRVLPALRDLLSW